MGVIRYQRPKIHRLEWVCGRSHIIIIIILRNHFLDKNKTSSNCANYNPLLNVVSGMKDVPQNTLLLSASCSAAPVNSGLAFLQWPHHGA